MPEPAPTLQYALDNEALTRPEYVSILTPGLSRAELETYSRTRIISPHFLETYWCIGGFLNHCNMHGPNRLFRFIPAMFTKVCVGPKTMSGLSKLQYFTHHLYTHTHTSKPKPLKVLFTFFPFSKGNSAVPLVYILWYWSHSVLCTLSY